MYRLVTLVALYEVSQVFLSTVYGTSIQYEALQLRA